MLTHIPFMRVAGRHTSRPSTPPILLSRMGAGEDLAYFCLRSCRYVYRTRIIFGLITICENFVKVYFIRYFSIPKSAVELPMRRVLTGKEQQSQMLSH